MEDVVIKNGLENEWTIFQKNGDEFCVEETYYCLKALEEGQSLHDILITLFTTIYLMPEDILEIMEKVAYFSTKGQNLIDYYNQNKQALIDEANNKIQRTQEIHRDHKKHRL